MNDLAVLDREPPRLSDGPMTDPAAMLLRSARADGSPAGSKDRVRAMLGISETVEASEGESVAELPLPNEIKRERRERSRRLRVIEPFIPFQHLIVPEKPASTRKLGAVMVASLQVAAIVAALFIRPFPRFELPKETAVSRRDEPEMVLLEPKAKTKTTILPTESLAKNNAKPGPLRTNIAARRNLERTPSAFRESVVTDEHAGLYSENSDFQAAADPLGGNEALKMALNKPPAPSVFAAGMSHPVRLAGLDPTYPVSARMRNVSGTVVMRCVVTTEGVARDCQIHKSPAYLDDAVLAASRTWRFAPAMDKGRPVSVFYVFKIKFQLG